MPSKKTKANQPKFFLPFAENDRQAERVWQSIKQFAEETTGWKVNKDQRIFSLAFTHNGIDYYAEVGKPEPETGEPVIAILCSNAYLVCTPNRGVMKDLPLLVGHQEAFGVIPFSDYKGNTSINYFQLEAKRTKGSSKVSGG